MTRNCWGRWGKGASRAAWSFLVAAGLAGFSGCSSLPLERSLDREAQCRLDMRQAVQLRGLTLKREVAIERESPEQLAKSLAAELDKSDNQAYLANTDVLLKQLRVLKKDDDLKALFLKVMGQQVAAYYDPEKKRVAYVEGGAKAVTNNAALPMIERFVYVHEFCHAVEDSHFDIERLSRESMCDFDRNMAFTSLVEGDAMLVGLDSVLAESPVNTATPFGAFAVHVMGRMDLTDEMASMGDCPAFLSGALLRPYLDGGIFSNTLRREAGWQAVNSVFQERLPKTTAEILYPERRFMRRFSPAQFRPDPSLFSSAQSGVLTNRVGAMGMALWLSGNTLVQHHQYEGFLKGWTGDQIFFLKARDGSVESTIWLSHWERSGQARSFCRKAERRLSEEGFKGTSWCVRRSGRLVAVVWSDNCGSDACRGAAERALTTQVETDVSGGFSSWCNDFPWPVRFPSYEGHSCGLELLGGHVMDSDKGKDFLRFNLVDGLVLRGEANPDRRYWGTLGGLIRYVHDDRSDFTFWKLPVVASWFRRGNGAEERYKWSVLWGLGGYGSESKASVLMIPVWRSGSDAEK